MLLSGGVLNVYKLKQIIKTACINFRRWHKNPQIILAFLMAFVVCFLLSDKVLSIADRQETTMQMFEPFIWTFGDANSVLIISLLLLLLFSDMPNLGNDVPFFLIRIDRKVWMLGQILYVMLATLVFVAFILVSTCVLCMTKAYPANIWSKTAAILGYSDIGREIAIPAYLKVLELSFPYECMLHIFGLMLGYSILMSSIILFLNLIRDNGGMIGGIIFSGIGFVLNPQLISDWFKLSQEQYKIANIAFGWMSPLNHATYYMHNFGYDNLPKLWVSYVFFFIGSVLFFGLSVFRMKKYSFNFTGTIRR